MLQSQQVDELTHANVAVVCCGLHAYTTRTVVAIKSSFCGSCCKSTFNENRRNESNENLCEGAISQRMTV